MQTGARRRRRLFGLAPPGGALALLLLATLLLGGCSLRRVAVRTVANALASGTDVYASDDDPELVGAALPFALKTMEGLLAQDPANPTLLLAAGRGFTQYAFAFVELPAQRLEADDFERAEQQRQRALKLFLRARGYTLRGLAAAHPGIDERLRREPTAGAAELTKDDLPLAYWTAAAWGSAIGVGKDHLDLLADLPAVRAIVERCLALDESWGGGALHAAMIGLETATPAALGGSPEHAKAQFDRALELSGGHDAMLFVTYAEELAVPAQDRDSFTAMLHQALAVDVDAAPDLRLVNTLAQQKATWLLAHADEYFLGDDTDDDATPTTPEGESTPPPDGDLP